MNSPTMSRADERALDVLLDELPSARVASGAGFVAPSKGAVEPERLEAGRRLLGALDYLDAPEPPADLMARTLDLVLRHPVNGLRPEVQEAPLSMQRNQVDA